MAPMAQVDAWQTCSLRMRLPTCKTSGNFTEHEATAYGVNVPKHHANLGTNCMQLLLRPLFCVHPFHGWLAGTVLGMCENPKIPTPFQMAFAMRLKNSKPDLSAQNQLTHRLSVPCSTLGTTQTNWLWVKTNGILFWGRCATHFSLL